jgi:tripartite-type tricarboxylate transporter receptor subunit TctC
MINSIRAFLWLALATAMPGAQAQTPKWPDRPVRIVVPVPPGGSTDRAARMLATRLTAEFGQQFVVDNRTGASGMIGAEIVARASPDGHTMAIVPATFAINAVLYKLPYDPVKGIAPISRIAAGPLVLTVHPSLRASTLTEFVALARAKPGSLSFGSSGAGSNLHLAGELFQQMAKVQMVHVPYRGEGPALAELLGAQIQLMFAGSGTVLPHMKSGKLRGLAVTSEKRSPAVPDLPAISEMLPGYAAGFWNGMWAPAGTPREIVLRLNQAIGRFLKQRDVQEWLRLEAAEPAHSTPEQFARVIATEIATWSKVVKTGNIKVE